MKAKRFCENAIHGFFLLMGLVTVGCVLLISVYLVVSGIPAIREIGLVKFLFGPVWNSNAAEPQFGILPFILTSIYGTAGAILLGVPVGFMTAVFLAKMAPPKLKTAVSAAVSLLAGIPSVVYGLVGMLVLVPGIRQVFHIPDGSGLLAAIIVLAIMILPSIITVAMTALEAVPREYEDASLALGATATETWFKVSVPAARSGIAAAVVLGVGRAIGEAMAVMMVSGNVPNMPSLFQSVRFLTTAVASEMGYAAAGLQRQALFSIALVLFLFIMLINAALNFFLNVYVLVKGVPNLSWQLLSTKPSYLDGSIGILPDIITTVCTVLTTLLVVLPLGVCAAVYLTEYAANKRVVAVIEYAAETLSGIPSIIYGLVGQMFFCQFLGMKKSLLAGAMTLVIMNLPTIMRTTQESLKTVPQSYREGAFGLGAGKWRTIRTVVLPGCVDGVLTGCILAVGRILGETAALLYTAGFAHTLYNSLRATLEGSGATLSVALYVYAKEQGEFDVAFAIAAILMALALLINLAAMLTGRYFKKRRSL